MPISVDWDAALPNTILYDFQEHWTWQEYYQAFERSLELAAALGGARYDVIGDLLRSSGLPSGSGITHVYSTLKRAPDNYGLTVVVSSSSFVRALVEVLHRVYPDTQRKLIVAPTLEAARQLIVEQRRSPAP